jgi:hypothetical protein
MWVILSWQHISPEVILKGFEKCFVSSAVDETDNMLWNGSEEDGNVRSECEGTGTDCEGGDSNMVW